MNDFGRQQEDRHVRRQRAFAGLCVFVVLSLLTGGFFWSFLPLSRPEGIAWMTKAILFPALCALVWYDLYEWRLPNLITVPLILAGLALSFLDGKMPGMMSVAGAAFGYLIIYALHLYYRRVRKMDGIGLGDAKLLAAIGAWFGVFAMGPALLLASVLGVVQAVTAKRMFSDSALPVAAIPFGPALAFTFWALSWGQYFLPEL